ncbi:hypothetical protein FVE85_8876 [Porphyridium purpureum]|uniref:Uncharacterized protein n=1 Tax=Porphyridium purpureum TaxID=35688 RepID=A0A5J4YPI4_PORPP|nr:hypothetical protein FVE85_8876 [Porphyridium purpureum]|eukprot:POR7751..scf296_7
MHTHNGRISRVPSTFAIPQAMQLQDAWVLWWLGTDELPAFRQLTCAELPSDGVRKRFSEWRKVFEMLISELNHRSGATVKAENATDAQKLLNQLYTHKVIPNSVIKHKGKKLRANKRTMGTQYKAMRKAEREKKSLHIIFSACNSP